MCRSTNRHFAAVYHTKKSENATGWSGKRPPPLREDRIAAARARDARALQRLESDFDPLPVAPAPVAKPASKQGRSRRHRGMDPLTLLVRHGITVKLAAGVEPRACSYTEYANL